METILQTVTFTDLLTLSTFVIGLQRKKKPLSLGVFIMYLQHTNIKLLFEYNFTPWIKVTTSPQAMLNLIHRNDEHFFLKNVTSPCSLLGWKAQTQLKIPGWGQDPHLYLTMFMFSLPSLPMLWIFVIFIVATS